MQFSYYIPVLVTKCNFYESSEYVYRNYLDLTELRGAQPEGYLARLVFYVQGSTDASVIFTTTKTPNLEKDTVYEFSMDAAIFDFFRSVFILIL